MPALSLAWFALISLACAFKDTIPVVIWSSYISDRLDSLATRPEPLTHTSHLFNTLLEGNELCQYDAVIIVEQTGLHASDLRTLSQSSSLSTHLSNAVSLLQIPYISHSGSDSLDEFKRTLMDRCGARRVELDLRKGSIEMTEGAKHVVCISMPELEGESTERQAVMRDHEIQLSDDISRVTSVFSTHLVIYTGSHPLAKRQHPISDDHSSLPVAESTSKAALAFAPVNTTLVDGNLLQRYRFFTPGLITALLIVFGLLVPILMVGIYALANIQSPLRMDAPKGPSLEKKIQ